MQIAYLYINCENIVVVKDYIEVIKTALERIGFNCQYITELSNINKKSLIVHILGLDAFKYYFRGYKNFILWQQGENADESYMNHKSIIRHWLLNTIDLFAMKKARFIFFVSRYMQKHYERLGKCSFKNKSYIMPCFNEELDMEMFKEKDYSQKVFCYVGSLSVWQCFPETVNLYKALEVRIPNIKLKILTFEVQKGLKILEKSGIKNFEIKSVPKEEVRQELIGATYGFIIRKDNIVNRVATPTKISSYMSAGVIPIFSSCIDDFNNISKSMKYALGVGQDIDIHKLEKFINTEIKKEEIQEEYNRIFNSYYSKSDHSNNISILLNNIFMDK